MHHQRYLQAVQLVQARFSLTKFITFHSLSLLLYAGVIRISKLLMHIILFEFVDLGHKDAKLNFLVSPSTKLLELF